VIVVGAGFAGLAVVDELSRTGMDVLLIDRNVYSTFQPLLYQVATGGLNPGDVSYPARAFTRQHGARFRLGEVTAVDPAARRITLADGAQLGYDPSGASSFGCGCATPDVAAGNPLVGSGSSRVIQVGLKLQF